MNKLVKDKWRPKPKTWDEFRETGLFWWINRILHTFGWVIVVEVKNEKVTKAYPARVKYRGFHEKSEINGYRNVANFMRKNSEELYTEAEYEEPEERKPKKK